MRMLKHSVAGKERKERKTEKKNKAILLGRLGGHSWGNGMS